MKNKLKELETIKDLLIKTEVRPKLGNRELLMDELSRSLAAAEAYNVLLKIFLFSEKKKINKEDLRSRLNIKSSRFYEIIKLFKKVGFIKEEDKTLAVYNIENLIDSEVVEVACQTIKKRNIFK
jgi:hypothetical protein